MPRFKTPYYGLKLIPVDFTQQVLPGTFEFTVRCFGALKLDLWNLRGERQSLQAARKLPEGLSAFIPVGVTRLATMDDQSRGKGGRVIG